VVLEHTGNWWRESDILGIVTQPAMTHAIAESTSSQRRNLFYGINSKHSDPMTLHTYRTVFEITELHVSYAQ
jgi:hypothetical protein